MAFQQILRAINDAAELAAESAVDAHGEEVPSAEIACLSTSNFTNRARSNVRPRFPGA